MLNDGDKVETSFPEHDFVVFLKSWLVSHIIPGIFLYRTYSTFSVSICSFVIDMFLRHLHFVCFPLRTSISKLLPTLWPHRRRGGDGPFALGQCKGVSRQ